MKIKCVIVISLLLSTMISACKSKQITSDEISSNTPQASDSPIVSSNVSPTPKTDEVPEPFKLAASKFISHDYDLSLKYIELTTTDFSDSKYAYRASIVKGFIIMSRCWAVFSLLDIFTKGVTKGRSLYSSDDRALVTKEMVSIREKLVKCKEETQSFANDFMNKIDPSINTIDYPELMTTSPASSKDLSFFKDVGYPIPAEIEVNEYLKTSSEAMADYYASAIFSTNKIDYPLFLQHLVALADEKELRKQMLQKIIDLTENDKYNEHRIFAQDAIKNL